MAAALRILVIDDDPVMRELLEPLLGYSGHRVTVVDSGFAALHLLESRRERFDVVLTDLHMPGIQGRELAARLLATRCPETLLVGMSGSSPTEDETSLLDEFLQKPFTPAQFEQALERARDATATPAQAFPPGALTEARTEATEPVLDETTFARLRASVSAEQLRGLYNLLLDDAHQRIDAIKANADHADLDAIHREAHALKGAAGMVGARQLYALAAALELDPVTDRLTLENFTLACERLRRMLDERLTPGGTAKPKH